MCHPQNKTKAQELYAQGQELANQERYDEAARSYELANKHCKRPGLLFHAAEMHRFAGNHFAALIRYQEYLDLEPYGEGSGPAHEHLAAGNLELLRQLWETSKTELASVGRGADTRALERRIVALGALLGYKSEPTKALIPRRQVLGAPFTDQHSWHRNTWPQWTLVGSGAITLAAGSLLYLNASELARQYDDRIRRDCNPPSGCMTDNLPQEVRDLSARVRIRELAAWSTAGIGALMLVYGSWRLDRKRRAGHRRPHHPGGNRRSATFVPYIGPRSEVGGAMGITF